MSNTMKEYDEALDRLVKNCPIIVPIGSKINEDTPLGGCISAEVCSSSLTRSFLPCFRCDSSILKKSKLDHVISKQENLVASLDKSSVEFKSKTEDLRELKKLKNKLGGKRSE